MTVYHPIKISGQPRRRRAIFWLALFLVLIFGLSRTDFRYWAGNISTGILKPFWSVGQGTENIFSGLGTIFTSKLKLTDENTRLRSIVDQQSIALLGQEILKQENSTLRQIVNRQSDSLPLTIGRLFSRGRQFPLGAAIIDIGLQNVNAPLVPGTVVASEGSVVLGELVEIYETKAKLRFYSTTGERLVGSLGEKHTPLELTGRGAGNFIASLPRDLEVVVNDHVTISVAGHEFLLAVVNDIQHAAGDSFQKIFLRSPVNISQLNWVEMYAP